jgi:nicotinate-nucleotide adenylyltransferase
VPSDDRPAPQLHQRIGILGGTFDPVHIGHLVVASEAVHQLNLDRLLMVVANSPWQKAGTRPISGAEDRFAVVSAAVGALSGPDASRIEASRIEIDRGGPSYTIDTVSELIRTEPGAELILVVGSDVAAELHTWNRASELATLAKLAVVGRPGASPVSTPLGWEVVHLTVPALEISSSDLRSRIVRCAPVEMLIPQPALQEIQRRKMYADLL